MPFFGSKKCNNSSSGSGEKRPAYPTQQAAAYPTQAAAAAAAPPAGFDAPPPYYSVTAPQQAAYPPQGFVPVGYHQQLFNGPPQTVVVNGGFDSGARFDGASRPTIPPPPPGCMPNAAQMAASQGHNVVVTQQKASVWTGGSDGGYTFF